MCVCVHYTGGLRMCSQVAVMLALAAAVIGLAFIMYRGLHVVSPLSRYYNSYTDVNIIDKAAASKGALSRDMIKAQPKLDDDGVPIARSPAPPAKSWSWFRKSKPKDTTTEDPAKAGEPEEIVE